MGSHGNALAVSFFRRRARLRSRAQILRDIDAILNKIGIVHLKRSFSKFKIKLRNILAHFNLQYDIISRENADRLSGHVT